VAGSLAVSIYGERLGKGEGYSEPGYPILREFNKVSEETPTTTTVHNTQAVNLHINLEPWNLTADHIFTPTKSIKREGEKKRPPELLWQHLDREKIEGIPLLKEMLDKHILENRE
jgi:5-formyltetrahydrofolate cyclo-ligase